MVLALGPPDSAGWERYSIADLGIYLSSWAMAAFNLWWGESHGAR
jgi:hypothetical protein